MQFSDSHRNKGSYIFIILFFLTLCFPLLGARLDSDVNLSGVVRETAEIPVSRESLMDGSYQSYINSEWEASFPGHKTLLRLRNQLLYSLLNVSPNENVVIGRDKYLLEPETILYITQANQPNPEEYFTALRDKLSALNIMMSNLGKELYVFISPTKGRYLEDKFPLRYSLLDNTSVYGYTNYEKLISVLDSTDIKYFDSIQYIESRMNLNPPGNSESLKAPVFYMNGTHWSHPWGFTCAAKFLDMMNSNSRYSLGKLKVVENVSEDPVYPDTDLYDTLNLIFSPKENWYSAETVFEKEGEDHPTIFLRGGSFMGQSLSQLIHMGIFGADVHFENSYYFTDRYTRALTLSNYDAYNEIDLDYLVGRSDILVLEVNEATINNMSWGFIEELINHPEYLDREYEEGY